ncbi:glycosyltransferase family 4 protein [Methanolobus mangrovi]|uniref:Glycosyltransferase family 4 protein n=1 Tax=Methanolobus mangrovi TaxID=3072977 RepID=A0AA51UHT4_9EURY|nr:glycosyltransferase family 4 protein [Methanolobus mangrovi]WMW23243.1 glycosyltransferase family 4 protein [Methanolobus mangrovi]
MKFEDVNIYSEKNIMDVPHSIVHIPVSPHIYPNSKFLLHVYSKLKKYPLIFNYHGDIRKEVELNYHSNKSINYSYIPTYFFLPSLLKSADQLIVHSYLFKNLVAENYGVKTAKVIPNALDNYWYSPEHELMLKKDGLEFFYHGRLSAEKGVDILIKGFHRFMSKRKISNAFLYIAGTGPLKKNLEKLIYDLKLQNNVILLGNVGKYIIKSYLKTVDAAIFPSLWDNFPLSYIEAFACANCPVYFSKKAGIYDFTLMSSNKLYAFEPTIENICDIIAAVYGKDYDEGVIKQQKEFALNYSWDRVICDYVNMYIEFYETC